MGLVLSGCGINVSFDAKYLGERGTAKSWVCPNGEVVDFDHKVSTSAAEMRCDGSKDPAKEVVNNDDCDCSNTNEKVSAKESSTDVCMQKADNLGFPEDLANYVCTGSYGNGATRILESGKEVVFGTIIFDNATSVWVLRDFVVPDITSYSYEYDGTEKSIFDAAVFYNDECFDSDGNRGVPCKICFDTTSEGCKLDIEFYN